MQQVWTIPARFSDDKDEMRIAHKRLRELCEMLPKEAVVDASKPAVKPPGQRRFEAAEGAALQVRYLVITPRGASRPQRAPRCRRRASLQPCVREAATPCDPM